MHTDAVYLLPLVNKIFDASDMTQYKDERYKNGYTSYFGKDHMPDIPEVNQLKNELIAICTKLATVQGVDLENNQLTVTDIWLNCMLRGGAHEPHVHAESHYSGTVYINNPVGVGKIKFHSPVRQYWEFCDPPKLKSADGNRESCAFVEFNPVPGRVVIWNSWLKHQVMEHNSDEPRLSISFNIYAEPK
jgi:uncharacterized protein (TIGR02466 family)